MWSRRRSVGVGSDWKGVFGKMPTERPMCVLLMPVQIGQSGSRRSGSSPSVAAGGRATVGTASSHTRPGLPLLPGAHLGRARPGLVITGQAQPGRANLRLGPARGHAYHWAVLQVRAPARVRAFRRLHRWSSEHRKVPFFMLRAGAAAPSESRDQRPFRGLGPAGSTPGHPLPAPSARHRGGLASGRRAPRGR